MTPIAWSWRDLALCRQVVTADYDPFFSDDPEDQDDALALSRSVRPRAPAWPTRSVLLNPMGFGAAGRRRSYNA